MGWFRTWTVTDTVSAGPWEPGEPDPTFAGTGDMKSKQSPEHSLILCHSYLWCCSARVSRAWARAVKKADEAWAPHREKQHQLEDQEEAGACNCLTGGLLPVSSFWTWALPLFPGPRWEKSQKEQDTGQRVFDPGILAR